VLELKAVDQLNRVHEAQMISYLRASGYPVGLLINFHTRLREGIRRFANTKP
jgi:GxxExxY protein